MRISDARSCVAIASILLHWRCSRREAFFCIFQLGLLKYVSQVLVFTNLISLSLVGCTDAIIDKELLLCMLLATALFGGRRQLDQDESR